MEHQQTVPDCSFYQVPTTLKISWKSAPAFVRDGGNKTTASIWQLFVFKIKNVSYKKMQV